MLHSFIIIITKGNECTLFLPHLEGNIFLILKRLKNYHAKGVDRSQKYGIVEV